MNASYGIRRKAGMGMLLTETFAHLGLIWRQILAYLAVFAVLGLSAPLFANGSAGLAGLLLYFIGQYWLFRSVLKSRGLLQTTRVHFLAFVGLAVVLILPITFGFVMLILPGLFLVARWIAAPAFIVAQGQGVFAAAGTSTAAVRGNTAKVAGAAVVLFLIGIAVSGVIEGIGRGLASAEVFGAVNSLNLVAGHLLPVLLLGLSTATFELLGPKDNSIEEVFG